MKKVFYTTFHKAGYELYGKIWIGSFLKMVEKNPDFEAVIYYEGFEPEILHDKITYIDFDVAVPNHYKWKDYIATNFKTKDYINKMTIRFSHKAMVTVHALKNLQADYLIWCDGDVEFIGTDYDGVPEKLLNDKFMACQVEYNSAGANHVESGLLFFDMSKKAEVEAFRLAFENNYKVENIMKVKEPYDGFIVYNTITEINANYEDLNVVTDTKGIKSNPDDTFLHTELNGRFVHNISFEGKAKYDNWNDVNKNDTVFSLVENAGKAYRKIKEKEAEIRRNLGVIK